MNLSLRWHLLYYTLNYTLYTITQAEPSVADDAIFTVGRRCSQPEPENAPASNFFHPLLIPSFGNGHKSS